MSRADLRVVAIAILVVASAACSRPKEKGEAGAVSATPAPQPNATVFAGRLFDGTFGTPLAGGHVFALSGDGRTVLGHARTKKCECPESGTFRLAGLPASGDVTLVGFHRRRRAAFFTLLTKLDGQSHDLGACVTKKAAGPLSDDGVPANAAPDPVLVPLIVSGWIAGELGEASGELYSTALADRLLDAAGEGEAAPSDLDPEPMPEPDLDPAQDPEPLPERARKKRRRPESPSSRSVLFLRNGDPLGWTVPGGAGSRTVEIREWESAGFSVTTADASKTILSPSLLSGYFAVRIDTYGWARPSRSSEGEALDAFVRSGGRLLSESASFTTVPLFRAFGLQRIEGVVKP